MAQYIDKAPVVTEIERRIEGLNKCHADTVAGYAGEISGLERLLSFFDTLEVKEVDLEKESKSDVRYDLIPSNHQIQDILEDIGMIDDDGTCPYTCEEIFRAGIEWNSKNLLNEIFNWVRTNFDLTHDYPRDAEEFIEGIKKYIKII